MKEHYLRRDSRIGITKDIISPFQLQLENIKTDMFKGWLYLLG